MDLREMGVFFEKKFIQFLKNDIDKVVKIYYNW